MVVLDPFSIPTSVTEHVKVDAKKEFWCLVTL